MTFTLRAGQSVPFSVSPVKADRSASTATLSGVAFSTDNASVATVSPDPSNPNGGILVAVAAGAAVLTGTAVATESDGTTTEKISGTVDITVEAATPAPAASLAFTFGTPTP